MSVFARIDIDYDIYIVTVICVCCVSVVCLRYLVGLAERKADVGNEDHSNWFAETNK